VSPTPAKITQVGAGEKMTSALDIMALALLKQLTARGGLRPRGLEITRDGGKYHCHVRSEPSLEDCKDILRQVIDEAADRSYPKIVRCE
jgi:hypothetical protein